LVELGPPARPDGGKLNLSAAARPVYQELALARIDRLKNRGVTPVALWNSAEKWL
jgi:hypothetical protein